MSELTVRPAVPAELSAIMQIYDSARIFMQTHGNPTQWYAGYPSEQTVRQEIACGDCYVLEDSAGTIAGVFSFPVGDEPTYRVIEGAWHAAAAYGTIHRLASAGTARGVAAACFAFCRSKMPYLRIDTHRDNLPMRRAIERAGFRPCGTIYVADGTPRLAFDWRAE